jgi:hypothetical protein
MLTCAEVLVTSAELERLYYRDALSSCPPALTALVVCGHWCQLALLFLVSSPKFSGLRRSAVCLCNVLTIIIQGQMADGRQKGQMRTRRGRAARELGRSGRLPLVRGLLVILRPPRPKGLVGVYSTHLTSDIKDRWLRVEGLLSGAAGSHSRPLQESEQGVRPAFEHL